jgi:uncharacterized protein involved in exopolysaccharide biosynthesis
MSLLPANLRRGARAAWARRWTFAVPVATLLLPAAVHAVRQPDVYEAKAFVAVRSVRPEHVGGGGALPQKSETRLEHVVTSAKNRLLTHENAAAIVPVLYPAKDPRDGLAVVAAKARVEFDQVGEGAFTVSTEDPDPERAARAVNALLDAFLESERRTLLEPARKRAEFMERELEKATAGLAAAREEVERFRAENPETMPDQKDAVLERMRRLDAAARDQETLSTNAARLSQEYERLLRQSPREGANARPPTAEEVQLDLQLRGAQNALDLARQEEATARTKYTERHPALARLAGEIRSLEEQVERAKEQLKGAKARADEQAARSHGEERRDWVSTLDRLRRTAVEEAKAASRQAQDVREEIYVLQERLSQMPAVEARYRPVRARFEDAAKVREDRERDARNARSAVDFYATTDAADFTGFDVKERAVVPPRPSGPQRWRFLAAAAGGGLLLGWLLLSLERRSREGLVSGSDDLEDLLPGALVVSVPLLGPGAPRRHRRVLREVALATYVLALAGSAAFAFAARAGVVDAPGWAKRILERTPEPVVATAETLR